MRKAIFELSAQDILRVTVIRDHTGERKDKKTVFCTANDLPTYNKSFVLLETQEKLILIEASDTLIQKLRNKSFY